MLNASVYILFTVTGRTSKHVSRKYKELIHFKHLPPILEVTVMIPLL